MLATLVSTCALVGQAQAHELPLIAVSKDNKGSWLSPARHSFPGASTTTTTARAAPRRLEDDWSTVETHFRQIKKLGANTVRIHLQVGKFMDGPDKPNPQGAEVEILDGSGAVLNLLREGDIFGEVGLLLSEARTATARARTLCDVFVLVKPSFARILRDQRSSPTRSRRSPCSVTSARLRSSI